MGGEGVNQRDSPKKQCEHTGQEEKYKPVACRVVCYLFLSGHHRRAVIRNQGAKDAMGCHAMLELLGVQTCFTR